MFPSAVIPLAAACKLATFGTGGCCAAMMGQKGCFVVACLVEREVGAKIVCGPCQIGCKRDKLFEFSAPTDWDPVIRLRCRHIDKMHRHDGKQWQIYNSVHSRPWIVSFSSEQ